MNEIGKSVLKHCPYALEHLASPDTYNQMAFFFSINVSMGTVNFIRNPLIKLHFIPKLGRRDSVVGIATRYGLEGDRMPVGAISSVPLQTVAEAHPASCTMGVRSFPGRGADHAPSFSTEVANGLELYLRRPYVPA